METSSGEIRTIGPKGVLISNGMVPWDCDTHHIFDEDHMYTDG